jgi:hypothetical protein
MSTLLTSNRTLNDTVVRSTSSQKRTNGTKADDASALLAFRWQDTEAIMFDFVKPAATGGRRLSGRRQTWLDNAQSWAGTLTQRHGHLIGMMPQRVESRWGVPSQILPSKIRIKRMTITRPSPPPP